METTPVKIRKAPTRRVDGAKVVGVAVPPAMYAKLVAFKERSALRSIKEALLVAAQLALDLDRVDVGRR